MSEPLIVLSRSAVLFLVLAVGWGGRRIGALTPAATGVLSRMVVEVTLPALVFVQMLRTAGPAELADAWWAPLAGLAVLLAGQVAGLVAGRLQPAGSRRRTTTFLVAIGNWIYLPLPIAEALYGDAGVRTVLLFNVGATVGLWTVGVWTLRPAPLRETLRELATNRGLLAAVAGVAAAAVPGLRELLSPGAAGPGLLSLGAGVGLQAADIVGGATIPMSLIAAGAQLADEAGPASLRDLSLVVVARLVGTPLLVTGALLAARFAGLPLAAVPAKVALLVAAMPVAVSAGMFVDRFGGDATLAARATFWSTLIGLGSVPLITAAAGAALGAI